MADNVNPEVDELDIAISATFEKASKAISALKSEILGINKTFGQIDTNKIAKNLLSSTDKALGQANKNSAKKKIKVEFSTEDAQKKISELRKKFADIEKDYKPKSSTEDSLIKEQEKWLKRLEQYKDREARTLAVGGNVNTNAFANMQYEISKASNVLGVLDTKLKSVREEMVKLQSTKPSNVKALLGTDTFTKEDIFEYLDNFEFRSKEFEQAKDNLMIAIQDDIGEDGYKSKELKSAIHYANEYIETLRKIEPESKKVDSLTEKIYTPQKQETGRKTINSEKVKSILGVGANDFGREDVYFYLDVYYEKYGTASKEFDKAVEKLLSAIEQDKNGITKEWDTAYEYSQDYVRLMKNLEIVGNMRDEFERMKQSIPYIGNKIKDVFGEVSKKKWEDMSKSVKKYGNALWSTVNPISKVSNSLKDLGKRIKKSRVVSALIYSWINGTVKQLSNSIKQGVADGSKNLVQYSDEYNRSISSMRSALLTLKNAFAVGFAPITNVVAPYIAKFINMLADAMNMVGQFFGALTGKKFVVQASKVWEDYGDTLDKTSDSASKLNNQLQGFDKLNNLTTSKSGGSGSGSGSNVKIEDMFTTEEINGYISDFAKKVQDAWAKSDFSEIGRILGTKFKEQLEHVNDDIFPEVKEFSSKFGKSLATGINGLVTTPGLGKEIGESIANVLITGINFSYEFFKNTNFKAIGKLIGDTINGFFDEMGKTDSTGLNGWQKMGKTFTNRMSGMLEMAITALETADWNKVGQAIGDYFSAIDWGRIVFDAGKLAVAIGKALVSAFGSWFKSDPLSATIVAGIGLAKLTGLSSMLSSKISSSLGGKLTIAIATIEIVGGAVSWGIEEGKKAGWFGEGIYSFSEAWDYVYNAEDSWEAFMDLMHRYGNDFKQIASDSWDFFTSLNKNLIEKYLGGSPFEGIKKVFSKAFNIEFDEESTKFDNMLKDKLNKTNKTTSKIGTSLKGLASVGASTTNSLIASNQKANNSFNQFGIGVNKTTQTAKNDITGFVQVASNGYMTFGRSTDTASNKVSGFTGKSSLFGIMGSSIMNGMKTGAVGTDTLSNSLGIASSRSDTLNSKSGRTFNVYSGVGTLNGALVGANENAKNLFNRNGKTFSVYSGVGTIASQLGGMATNLSSIFSKNGKTLSFSIAATAKSIASKGVFGYLFGKADGGSFYGGAWHKIDQYASGGVPNYGTHFIAGERGPEVVGHINGRSEVLNQSQMASVMYDAVVAGMSTAMRNAGGSNVTVQIDGKEVFRAVRKQDNQYKNVNGHSAFAY